MALWVKICGLTSVDDALAAVDAGADAIGLNLVPSSKRCITAELAADIAARVGERARAVAVVADQTPGELAALRQSTGISWLQLHGYEPHSLLEALLPNAYKAVAIGAAEDAVQAERYGGELLLCDAKVAGVLGGSGKSFDWRLVTKLARRRDIVLAGGLNPDNVATAVQAVKPFGVDVASGVEGADPRRKNAALMAQFVARARAAVQP